MGRIKLKLPEDFPFETTIDVRISDINYGGHLGNDTMLSIIHEARVRCLGEVGFSELEAGGAGIIMSDCAIVYKAEVFHGETLTVKVAVADFSSVGCDFMYLVLGEDERVVAQAKTGIVFFDYNKRKITAVPDSFKKAFQAS